MHVVLFCHSLISCWNHGNAHFLRGIVGELQARGHSVDVHEPQDAWSVTQLLAHQGAAALRDVGRVYPDLRSQRDDPATLDLHAVLAPADLVLVHEWNDADLVRRIGEHRRDHGHYRLLFHDTHHRSLTDPAAMAAYDLRHYDGVLAFGRVIRDLYLGRGWAARAWTWHEAADIRVFRPLGATAGSPLRRGLVWVGNWGDGERSAELREFLLEPVRDLALPATVHGVRYPDAALAALRAAGIRDGGWLPNHSVPRVFAQHAMTVHVPRRPYVQALPGIPTIRVFEALACGIPLVCAPWEDAEGLFTPGKDFLVARDGRQMRAHLRALLHEPALARSLAEHGLRTLRARHSCSHRVDELLAINDSLRPAPALARSAAA